MDTLLGFLLLAWRSTSNLSSPAFKCAAVCILSLLKSYRASSKARTFSDVASRIVRLSCLRSMYCAARSCRTAQPKRQSDNSLTWMKRGRGEGGAAGRHRRSRREWYSRSRTMRAECALQEVIGQAKYARIFGSMISIPSQSGERSNCPCSLWLFRLNIVFSSPERCNTSGDGETDRLIYNSKLGNVNVGLDARKETTFILVVLGPIGTMAKTQARYLQHDNITGTRSDGRRQYPRSTAARCNSNRNT